MIAEPKVTRPLQNVAFFHFEMRTIEGPAYVFMAVDALDGHAFNLQVEQDNRPETILKNIYLLLEDPYFVEHGGNGITLVLEDHEDLADRIRKILKPFHGKLMFNKAYNNYLANPVMLSMLESMKGKD